MITGTDLYWLTRLDGVKDTLHGLVGLDIFLAVTLVLGLTLACVCSDNWSRGRILGMVTSVVLGSMLGMLLHVAYVLVPTTKEMAAIMVVPRIANSETVQEIGEGVRTLAREWLEELRPKGSGVAP